MRGLNKWNLEAHLPHDWHETQPWHCLQSVISVYVIAYQFLMDDVEHVFLDISSLLCTQIVYEVAQDGPVNLVWFSDLYIELDAWLTANRPLDFCFLLPDEPLHASRRVSLILSHYLLRLNTWPWAVLQRCTIGFLFSCPLTLESLLIYQRSSCIAKEKRKWPKMMLVEIVRGVLA